MAISGGVEAGGSVGHGGSFADRSHREVEFDPEFSLMIEEYLERLRLTHESWDMPDAEFGVRGFVTDLPASLFFIGQNVEQMKGRSAVYWELADGQFRVVADIENMGRLSPEQVKAAVWYGGLQVLIYKYTTIEDFWSVSIEYAGITIANKRKRGKSRMGRSVRLEIRYPLPDEYSEHDVSRWQAVLEAAADCMSFEKIVAAFTRATRPVVGNRGGVDDGDLLK